MSHSRLFIPRNYYPIHSYYVSNLERRLKHYTVELFNMHIELHSRGPYSIPNR